MSTPYIGEIRAVGFTFPPVGWMSCDGAAVNIAEYEALFALVGTTYGGDGVTTFNLPDLRSRVIVGAQGAGPGLSTYTRGQQGGTEQVTLTTQQLPAHTHAFTGSVAAATVGAANNDPAGRFPGTATSPMYTSNATPNATLQAGALTGPTVAAGGSQSHANIQPVLAMNYIICMEGIYPPQ